MADALFVAGGFMGFGVAMMTGPSWAPACYRRIASLWERKAPEAGVAKLIIGLLDEHPSDWRADDHRLSRANPTVSIWTANGADSVGISLRGDAWPASSGRPGGLPMNGYWRREIWKAVARHRQRAFELETIRFCNEIIDNVIPLSAARKG